MTVSENAGGIRIGCGQVTWKPGVPEEQVLSDIAAAGYEAAMPRASLPRSAEDTLAVYREHGLVAAPPYFGAPFWDRDQHDDVVARARDAARLAQGLGCTELYVAPGGGYYKGVAGRTRRQVAGHVSPEDGLGEEQWKTLVDTLNEVGAMTQELGVAACFHNHVGTVIETGEEMERLMAETDPALVLLGPDTGHLQWGGCDPVSFFRRHAGRVRTAHLKDISEEVRRRGVAEGWDYGRFSESGIFRELGDGDVDHAAIIDVLRSAGFKGWLIVETDVTQLPTARESAAVSRAYLRTLGL